MVPTVEALIRHVVVGGLWYPVKRRAERELIAELARGRYSSFPFISSDTFRALCDVVIENNGLQRRLPIAARSLIYFDLSEITGTERGFEDTPSLRLLLGELDHSPEPPVVIMSHGDLVPSWDLLSEVARRAKMVFSINLTEETNRIRGIPLGLENMSRNNNGRLTDFFQNQYVHESNARTREVFTAFEPENNLSARAPLVELLRESRFGWNSRRMHPKKYREAVKESMFVLSPPGRGLDCHRTWEAIYLGAVPVVLDGSLPKGLLEDLPVYSVPSYEAFLSLNPREMVELFKEVRSIKASKAYMPFWVKTVLASVDE